MLSKTESLTPDFDKSVEFPNKISTPIKRRRIIPLISAACLIVVLVSVLPFALNRGDDTEIPDYLSNNSDHLSDISGISDPTYENDTSGVISDNSETSIEFSENGDESRDVLNNSSDVDIDQSGDESSKIDFKFPTDEKYFANESASSIDELNDYFYANPIDYLDAYVRLPIYKKHEISEEDLSKLSVSVAKDLSISFTSVNYKNGHLIACDESDNLTFDMSKYGDWIISWQNDYAVVIKQYNDYDFVEAAIERFIDQNKTLFTSDDYEITVKENDETLIVYLFENDRSDSVLRKHYSHKFVFAKLSDGCALASVCSMMNDMQSIGKFETIFYKDALEILCDPSCVDKMGYNLQKYENYEILGYDVRYIYSHDFVDVCPYYVFALKVGASDEIEFCYIPAIVLE